MLCMVSQMHLSSGTPISRSCRPCCLLCSSPDSSWAFFCSWCILWAGELGVLGGGTGSGIF